MSVSLKPHFLYFRVSTLKKPQNDKETEASTSGIHKNCPLKPNEADFSPSEPIRPLLENDVEEILEDLTLEDAGNDLETFREKWKAELERNKKKEEANELTSWKRPRSCFGKDATTKAGNMSEAGPSTSKKLRNDEETEALDLNLVFNERLDQRDTYFLSEDKN
ncbi:hypothetical protein L596_030028 [Steinernema carpocapsae]|uniref:Uncharacterized protein n=1 Tax=Steinernema carpocapsae TaxID=34508 RepID=A0A4U5LRI6_STECR|nr:hypothetical protein L596_030028 [Steinernema carpocapsae]